MNKNPYHEIDEKGRFIKKHGGTKEKLFNVWVSMRQRCSNPNNPEYKNYGARGISICEEWNDYERFKEWALSNGYEEGLSIDRINNNEGYRPGNCRWATLSMQNSNRRSFTNKTGVIGVHQRPNGNYRAQVRRNNIVYSLGTFKTLEAAKQARQDFIEHYGY